jgi:cyclophilin family peptidyl-prolyl cis-trans isomerase
VVLAQDGVKATEAGKAAEGKAPAKDTKNATADAKAKKASTEDKGGKKSAKGAKTMKAGNFEFDVKTATMKTSQGEIKMEFYYRQAGNYLPGEADLEKKSKDEFESSFNANVKGIEQAAGKGHYNGRIFHRVIDGFMIQLGLTQKLADDKDASVKPARLEAQNGLKNLRGTVAMARTSDPNSATTQFFINLRDNSFLDASPGNPGYTVVGKVVGGMETVDKIAKVKTGNFGIHADVPATPVIIEAFSFDK